MRRPPNSNREYFYGHSPLRYVNDGKDVVPGLVETWESNDDASEWTFHFRKGLKWSDGEPWSTADIMFWWNDIIAEQYMAQTAPDEARSGKGTLAKFNAVDDVDPDDDLRRAGSADRRPDGHVGERQHRQERAHLDDAEPLRQAVPPEVRQGRARRTGTPSAA